MHPARHQRRLCLDHGLQQRQVRTAGVPGGSIPLIVIVLQTVGVPAEGIGIILGVDRFLDMCRTTLNVTGDLVCATVVARSEKELRFDAPSVEAAAQDA